MYFYILLFLIIFLFMILIFAYNIYSSSISINFVKSEQQLIKEKKCIDMRWGCCPDGVSTKYDDYGTNCRGF